LFGRQSREICGDRRAFTYTADNKFAIHALEQSLKVNILGGVIANDGVFDSYTEAVINQSPQRVEPGLFV
jgi:hypothetical protein